MSKTEKLINIPDEKVQKVIDSFLNEGAQVKKEKQPDGRWTVTATFTK